MCHRQKTNAHNICFCIQKVKCRIATLEELQLCHSEAYALLYGTMAENRAQLPASILGKKERENDGMEGDISHCVIQKIIH